MKLMLFVVGFTVFAVAGYWMFSEPYTKTILVRGESYDMTLYRNFYAGLPFWLAGVLMVFVSFIYESVKSRVFHSSQRSNT